MTKSVVLVADSDLPEGQALAQRLSDRGARVVWGARDQVRLSRVAASDVFCITVPEADAADCAVVLATVVDAMGPLQAVVVPVAIGAGKPAAQVGGVAAAMVLAMGLAEAADAIGVPVHVCGVGAKAVAAWVHERQGVTLSVGLPGDLENLEDSGTEPVDEPRRRVRVRDRARRLAQRMLVRTSS